MRRDWTGPPRPVGGCLLGAALLLAVPAALAGAHAGAPDDVQHVRFDQRIGGQVPAELAFRDQSGQPVTLGTYFGARPIVLTMNQLDCPRLCPLVIEGLATGMKGMPLELGQDFTVITVGIDGQAGADLAAATRQRALRAYGTPGAADGWQVLTGGHDEIDRLAEAVGFRYSYDAADDSYAHPAGVVILTPGGVISRYLYGIDFAPVDLRLALVDAGQRRIGSVVDQVLLVCYRYEPVTGRYTPAIERGLQVAGVLIVLALGTFIWRLSRRGPEDPAPQPTAEG